MYVIWEYVLCARMYVWLCANRMKHVHQIYDIYLFC